MAGPATTGAFSNFLFPILKEVYGAAYKELESIYTKLVRVEESDKEFEDFQEIITFGLVPEHQEGRAVAIDSARQGFKTRYEMRDYSLGYEVTHQLKRGDKSRQIRQLPEALAATVNRTIETIIANLFNNGFDSAVYALIDGQAFFSTAHVTFSGTRQNRPTANADFNLSSWQQANIDIAETRDSRGNRILNAPTLVFGNTFNSTPFKRVLQSPDDPSTAARSINPFHRSADFLASPYLTAQKAWFTKNNIPNGGACWFWREHPEFMNMNVDDQLKERHMVHFAGSGGVHNWRDYYGSPGL